MATVPHGHALAVVAYGSGATVTPFILTFQSETLTPIYGHSDARLR